MVITLLICCMGLGFVLADTILSIRILWRTVNDVPTNDLPRRVDWKVVNVVWLLTIILWFVGLRQAS